jgi:hypothetical protein
MNRTNRVGTRLAEELATLMPLARGDAVRQKSELILIFRFETAAELVYHVRHARLFSVYISGQ